MWAGVFRTLKLVIHFIISVFAFSGTSFAWQGDLSEHWHLPETEIYQPFSSSRIAFDADAGWYLLDRDEQEILHYTPQGVLQKRFAGHGQGPGRLAAAGRLHLLSGALYVYQHQVVDQFDLNGDHLQRFTLPDQLSRVEKVTNGWVGLQGIHTFSLKQPLQLLWFDENFTESKVLGEWASEYDRIGREPPTMQRPDLSKPFKFLVVEAHTRLTVDATRRIVFVHPGGTNRIEAYDVETLSRRFAKRLEREPHPFYEPYGEAVIAEFRQMLKTRGIKRQLEADFPEHFPLVQTMGLTPSNRLLVEFWNPQPAQYLRDGYEPDDAHKMVLDDRGQPQSFTTLDYLNLRVVALTDAFVYLSVYDPDTEMYTVARFPREAALAFAETFALPRDQGL